MLGLGVDRFLCPANRTGVRDGRDIPILPLRYCKTLGLSIRTNLCANFCANSQLINTIDLIALTNQTDCLHKNLC